MTNRTTREQSAGGSTRRDRRRVTKRRTSGLSSSQTSSHPSSSNSRTAVGPYPGAAPRSAAAPRRFSARLASARDQQRLGERNRQERARVEEMLAAAPAPLDSPGEMPIESTVAWDSTIELRPNRVSFLPEFVRDSPRKSPQESLEGLAPQGCPVCGGTRVACDEVMQLGTLRLSECLRCEHRWTERGPDRWAEIGAPMKHYLRRTSGTRPTQA